MRLNASYYSHILVHAASRDIPIHIDIHIRAHVTIHIYIYTHIPIHIQNIPLQRITTNPTPVVHPRSGSQATSLLLEQGKQEQALGLGLKGLGFGG